MKPLRDNVVIMMHPNVGAKFCFQPMTAVNAAMPLPTDEQRKIAASNNPADWLELPIVKLGFEGNKAVKITDDAITVQRNDETRLRFPMAGLDAFTYTAEVNRIQGSAIRLTAGPVRFFTKN